jgi:2-amino-4-hydroxy-6-hydroxymethyldihydropteridine diphosphokinase
MTLAYIAIGSNLASPLEQVNAAVEALGEIPQSRIVAVSSFYRTRRWGAGSARLPQRRRGS